MQYQFAVYDLMICVRYAQTTVVKLKIDCDVDCWPTRQFKNRITEHWAPNMKHAFVYFSIVGAEFNWLSINHSDCVYVQKTLHSVAFFFLSSFGEWKKKNRQKYRFMFGFFFLFFSFFCIYSDECININNVAVSNGDHINATNIG